MTLAHDDLGSGPVVVLLHAGIADRRMWAEQGRRLAASGHRSIALDLPGFGESPPPREIDAPWEDVSATLEQLGADHFTLCGSSFGGAVALRVAALAPERVAGLLLVSAPDDEIEPSPALRHAWDAEEKALECRDVAAATRAVVDAWTQPGSPPAIREHVAEMQRHAFAVQLGAPDVPEGEDPLKRSPAGLAGRFPALVAVGERDMPDFHASAERIAAALGVAPVRTIAGAGHLAPLERPRAFAALLDELIARSGTRRG